eukprot:10035859-Ditylum_brightwellii.AAC.1
MDMQWSLMIGNTVETYKRSRLSIKLHMYGTAVQAIQTMTTDKTPLKWQNAVQNHQNGEPLPVLDLAINGYEP